MSWWRNPDVFLIDLRYALRRLRNQPGFAIVACLSLAIGIGSATAGFGVLYAVMVRDLPVRDPERLAVVSTQGTGSSTACRIRPTSTSATGRQRSTG